MDNSSNDAKIEMNHTALEIDGVFAFNFVPHLDSRGHFQRLYDEEIFSKFHPIQIVQSSFSYNLKAGTVRGLHFQATPSQEWKVVTCVLGSIKDFLLDTRVESPTYNKKLTISLSEKDGLSLLIPPQVAHGYQTLEDNSGLVYQMSAKFEAEFSKRINILDSALGLDFSLPITEISNEDRFADKWNPKSSY